MIKVKTYSPYFEVSQNLVYSNDGKPEIEVVINESPEFNEMLNQLNRLETRVNIIESIQQQERALLDSHPGLKDLYDQYQVMLNLVK